MHEDAAAAGVRAVNRTTGKMEKGATASFGITQVKNPPLFRKVPLKKVSKGNDNTDATERETSLDSHTGTKMSFCVQLLKEGCVQSFGDFFFLTHRPEPATGEWSG